MMALVRSVMAASTDSADTSSVSRSTSTKTGVAPIRWIMFGVETQVMEGVMTSSPGPMSMALSTRCIAAVADETATADWARPIADGLLEFSAPRTCRDPPTPKRVDHGRDVGIVDRRTAEWQKRLI